MLIYFFFLFQVKESESDPLLTVENGPAVVTDSAATKAPVWNSDKDLRA